MIWLNMSKERERDDRIMVISPTKNIRNTLEQYGYPFKSKEHSMRVYQFNTNHNGNYIKKYISGYDVKGKKSSFVCPQRLLYQFEEKGKYNYSDKCCYNLKKQPAKKWAKENSKTIVLTGMRADEGGNRKRLGCTIFKSGKLQKFHPLIVISEEWENEFITKNNIQLCKLYYEPYNFNRTGCKGCPFSLDLQEQLDIMDRYLPAEKKQCELIWKPVYDEYRRIGYRLRKNKERQLTIDEFIGEDDE